MKLIAIINVIAWSGFWAFGYLAISANGFSEAQIVTAALLAAGGSLPASLLICAWPVLLSRADMQKNPIK